MFSKISTLTRIGAILCLGVPFVCADGAQTGVLAGIITAKGGGSLGGVTIRIEGPALQQPRVTTSGPSGDFRFALLPPGTYFVTATLGGYQTVRSQLSVAVNQTTRFSFNLPRADEAQATVVVESSAPVVDTQSTTTQTNLDKTVADKLPVGRTYQGMMALTPGVVGTGNASVLGSRTSDNVFLVDGVDTTDPTTGTFGMNLAEDAIEEVQTLTAGISAEYGRFGGAVVNVVTKSGSNEWGGSLRYNLSNVMWNALAPMGSKQESNLVTTPFATLGGPIVKDRLWFFATFQLPKTSSIQTTNPGPTGGGGIQFDRVFKGKFFSLKFTYALNPDHQLQFQATGDPAEINRINYGSTTFLDTTTFQEQGGQFLSLSYRGMLTPSLALEGKLGRQQSKIEVKGNGGSKIAFYDQVNSYRLYENGPFEGYTKRPRTQGNVALTWFGEMLGTHELRAGLDFQTTESRNKFGSIGGAEVYFDGFTDGSAVNGLDYNMAPGSSYMEIYTPLQESTTTNNYRALYFNDRWKVNSHWSLNLGLRFEKVDSTNDVKEKIWDYNTLSPRFGVTWDPKGDGQRSASLFFGRYYQSPWQDALDDTNRLAQGYSDYLYVSGDPHLRASYNSTPDYTFTPAGNSLQYAKDIKGSYDDELQLVYKESFGQGASYQVQLVNKKFYDQLDTRVFYSQTSPGVYEKITRLENARNSERNYTGLILVGDYRSEQWWFNGSLTLSRLSGNHDSSSQTSSFNNFTTGTYSPSFSDNNASGLLGADRPIMLKLALARSFTWGRLNWDNGFRATYTSGAPYNVQAIRVDTGAPAYVAAADRRFTVIMGRSRGMSRFRDTWTLDYTSTLNFRIAKKFSTFLRMDITNLLNKQQIASWDTSATYNAASGGFVPGSNFGRQTGPGHFVTPRTIAFSLGVRF